MFLYTEREEFELAFLVALGFEEGFGSLSRSCVLFSAALSGKCGSVTPSPTFHYEVGAEKVAERGKIGVLYQTASFSDLIELQVVDGGAGFPAWEG
jgi:hypothetical protein